MEIKQPTAVWKEIHKELLQLPFCIYRQQLVRLTISFKRMSHRSGGLCSFCLRKGIEHIPRYTPPLENISSFSFLDSNPPFKKMRMVRHFYH